MNIMKLMKKFMPIVFAVAAGLILVGIILFAFAVPNASSAFFTACFVIIALLFVIAGAGVLFLLYLCRDSDPNFFLYDTEIAQNMDVADLTFEQVNSRMSYFMSTLSTSQERLWSENVLSANAARFGINEVYRPLAAYKMLYDLAEIDRPEGWQFFLCASTVTIDTLLATLQENGEDDMLTKLRYAYNNATDREDIDWLRDYVKGNEKYISHRMMSYVRKNIEWFY